jgi:hypothetical protein
MFRPAEFGAARAPERTFTYGEIENALATMHNVPDGARGTFKSRLKHFQRIGVVPASPGKGQKLDYQIDDAVKWAACFEFAELGLPPDQIKLLLRFCSRLFESFKGPVQNEDQILVVTANFLEWYLEDAVARGEGMETLGAALPKAWAVVPLSKVHEKVLARKHFARAFLINLTEVKRKLGKALHYDWR